ncbi:MAG: hypothetical protein RI932_2208 [Pseudomonadota bacterium]
MTTRINLQHYPPRKLTFRRLPQILFEATAPLALLNLTLMFLPVSHHSNTVLEQVSNSAFFTALRAKCLNLNAPVHLLELKDNFLTNERLSDPELRQTFQSAGLSHLLALSGSQTGPVAWITCVVVISLLIACLSSAQNLAKHSIVRSIRLFGLLTEFATLVCLVGLFQSTGALNRILSSKICCFILEPLKAGLGEFRVHSLLLHPRITLTLPWILAFLLGKNPVHDLSFLLSALGAHTAQVVATLVQTTWAQDDKDSRFKKKRIAKCCFTAAQQVAQWVLITALTSALMCIFCLQLWPIDNMAKKILANLLAGPVVLFLITPSAMTVIISVMFELNSCLALSGFLFETGLEVLLLIAQSFAESETVASAPATAFLRPGSAVAWHMHPYLGLHLLILFLAGIQFHLQRFRVVMLKNSTPNSLPGQRFSDSH